MSEKNITKRSEDYSQWYLDVIEAADLADYGPVKGTMIIKPYGYAIWENLQKIFNKKFKETGVENAYFPMFIPESFLKREADHVEGFAPEVAVVTHVGGKKLDEPLIVRPTSETIIYDSFGKWIKSYRDLPLLINQWANIVRWEMRTRLFLRTSEFLWQEGHTAHSSEEEAEDRTRKMLNVYKNVAEEYLALPVVDGQKTESEKFAGAERTYAIEGMMQDGKALQAGTSHMLGQNFAKAFDVKYLDKEGKEQFVWLTSWGVSTRLIGALIMAHSDDKGLVLPPKIAPTQVIIVPVWTNDEEKSVIIDKAKEVKRVLDKIFTVKLDDREGRPGPKFFEWEKKGVPVRIEIGPRDLANNSVVIVRRDNGEKITVRMTEIKETIEGLMKDIQESIYKKAQLFREENTRRIDKWEEFEENFKSDGGFVLAHWCGSEECEAEINQKTKATIRVIPFDQPEEDGKCILCGKESKKRVIFAKAY
jgi:prolyl-tRNA synthetase